MGTTYQKADKSVVDLANELLTEFKTHQPLLDARVKIDIVMAFAAVDEKTNVPVGPSLTKNGTPVLGIARKLGIKDRAKGMGDCEVSLDGWWWEQASPEEQRALLDHELHHFSIKIKKGALLKDDLGRPLIFLRKHDYEFGWFNVIADRHAEHSQERIQAASILDNHGQYYWPTLAKK